MKQRRLILSLIFAAAVLFASLFPASAIDFVAEDTYQSVFVICSGDALGSGFAVGANCIVTNAHVIQDPWQVTVRCYDGTGYTAQVLGMDSDQDIAVLVVAEADFPPLQMADISTMNTGDDVFAIGAPKSMAYTLTKGVISAKARTVGLYRYIQTDAPINEGNSGGPLLNTWGQVLGMNTLKMKDSEGIGLAIPADRICDYLQTLGISLNESGNVPGTIEPPAGPAPTEQSPVPTDPGTEYSPEPLPESDQSDRTAALLAVTIVILGVSVTVNIVLAILLISEKRKHLTPVSDPRERTDFDIDILE